MNHISIGVYANGDHVVNIVKEEHIIAYINYNIHMRPGRALLVDGECVNQGYLKDEDIDKWKDKIKAMNINSNMASQKYR